MTTLTMSADKLSLLEVGKPFVWRGTLDWPLFGRYLNEGPDVVRGIFADRRACGANTICCAGMLGWWPGLNPSNPKYWESLRPFVELAEKEGIRICFVVFCDTATLMPDQPAQLAHWERFLTTLGDKPVTFVGVNQPGHGTQHIDPLALYKLPSFPGLLCARDNPMESGNPIKPVMDLACYCCSRDTRKFFNIGASIAQIVGGWPDNMGEWSGAHVATVLFEPWHARPGDASSDPGLWRQIARSLCFRGSVGGNFYSDQCSQAALLTGVERMCAVEFLGNLPSP